MKTYISSFDIGSVSEQQELIQILQGELTITNNTHIYNEQMITRSFSSVIVIENSKISEISYLRPPIEGISSTMTIINLTIERASEVYSQFDISVILSTSGILTVSGITITDSSVPLIHLLSTSAHLNDLNFDNVTDTLEFIKTRDSDVFTLNNISLTNIPQYSATSANPEGLYLVSIESSKDVQISDLNLSGLQKSLCLFTDSNITVIDNVQISGGNQVFTFENSIVTEIKDSEFENNTQAGQTTGGVIHMENSIINIKNTTFFNNTASSGGSIGFE